MKRRAGRRSINMASLDGSITLVEAKGSASRA